MPEGSASTTLSSRRRLGAVIGILCAAVAVNVTLFQATEPDTRYDALRRYPNDNPILLGYEGSNLVRKRIAAPVALAQIAPGSVITMPETGFPHAAALRMWLRGLGQVSRINEVPEQTIQDMLVARPNFDPEPFIVASGPGAAPDTSWAIAVAGPPATAGDPERYLSRALRTGPERPPMAGASAGAREFLLVEWPGLVPSCDHWPCQLFLETALLTGAGAAGRPTDGSGPEGPADR